VNEAARPPRRAWIVIVAFALLTFGVPFSLMTLTNEQPVELRLIATDDFFSGLFVSDSGRVLLVNTSDRAEARGLPGRLALPWEPRPSVILTTGRDENAGSAWEALLASGAGRLVVVGIPGASPSWAELEEFCREENIQITYVAESSRIGIGELALTLLGPGESGDRTMALVARVDEANVAVSLDNMFVPVSAQVSVGNGGGNPGAALEIRTALPTESEVPVVFVDDDEIVRLVFAGTKVHVRGGELLQAEIPARVED
jgi:hypothetical protein